MDKELAEELVAMAKALGHYDKHTDCDYCIAKGYLEALKDKKKGK